MLADYHDFDYITSGFDHGFSLGLIDNPQYKTQQLPSRLATPELLQKVSEEVKKGHILGPFLKPVPVLKISPAYAIPKPGTTKARLIFNLSSPFQSSVNDNIRDSARSVQYCSVIDVALWLRDQEATSEVYMAKVDLTDAYRMVPIRKQDWMHLGMAVGNDVYIDRCLPMGAASSCQIFQRISDALAWLATPPTIEGRIFNYLDDFLILAYSKEKCQQHLDKFLMMCDRLSISVSAHKTIRPTQSITFLGIIICSNQCTLSMPEEKLLNTRLLLDKFLACTRPIVHKWQKLLGILQHVSQVVTAGRVYLGSVYGALKGILSQERWVKRSITSEIRKDLIVWRSFLNNSPSKSFKMLRISDEPDFIIATDACTSIGFGCTFQEKWFCGSWPNDDWKKANIAVLELYPIFVAVNLWRSKFVNKTVKIMTDNWAVVEILKKLYSKDTFIRVLLRPVADLCMNNNILLIPSHIAGVNNVAPDFISRERFRELHNKYPDLNARPEVIPKHLLPESLCLQ